MITNLKITYINEHEILAGSVPFGVFAYRCTYVVPSLFAKEEKVFNIQSQIKLSETDIKNKIIKFHFE